MFSFIAEKEETIKHCLKNNTPFLNALTVNKILKSKDIKINGKRIKEDAIVFNGDKVEVFFDFEKHLKELVKIIYEDENIIIIDKPQGIETVSDNVNRFTLQTYLRTFIKDVKAVHRLDLNTKGIVIFSKNEIAENELNKAIKNRLITKIYKALVYSENEITPILYSDYIIEDKTNKISKITTKNSKKLAELQILNVKNINKNLALIDILLITGRMHQIRCQLAYHKIYVLGDGKYGDKNINKKYGKDKQLLKATTIKFNLPNSYKLCYLNDKVFNAQFDVNLKGIINE